jgi:hypothetical protein
MPCTTAAALRRGIIFACVFPLANLLAQGNPGTTSAGSATAARGASAAAGTKVLNLEDYGRWQRISGTSISADGKWMSFTTTPNEGGGPTLHIKPIDAGEEILIPLGGGAGGAGGGGRGGAGGAGGGSAPAFSDDARWITYTVVPSAGRGGGGGGRGAASGNTPPTPAGRGATPATTQPTAPGARLELRNLATGTVERTFTGVASSQFSPGSRYLVLLMSRPQGAPTTAAADIVLHELATGANRNIGNVAQFSFNEDGRFLAYTIQAPEKLGNGIFLFDASTGLTLTLISESADFDAMTWNGDGSGLSALRGHTPTGMKQRENVLLAWSGIGSGTPKTFTFDASQEASFPKGFVLSEYSVPRWSSDGSRFFIGIKEQEPEIAAADSNRANVDIWHWADHQAQSVQIQQINQLRRATLPGVVFVDTRKFVQLGDDDMRTVAMAANNNVGIGRNDSPYRGEIAWGASRADIYKVDVSSGARTLIDKAVSRAYGTSPDSKWYLYAKGKLARVVNLETGTAVTLDASGTPTRSYINEDDDHDYDLPLWGVGGWTRDGKSVLLYDKFDIWSVPLDGSRATNITRGVGRSQSITFRITRFGGGGGGGRGGGAGAADSAGIDMTKEMTLAATGRLSKRGRRAVAAG